MPKPFNNKVLKNLSPEAIERLQLHKVELKVNHEIEFPGKAIDSLHFIESGIGSMTTTFEDGSQVEVGMFGYESVMGASVLMGTRRSLNRVYMQASGQGYVTTVANAMAEFKRFDHFHDLILRYVQAQLTQTAQSAGCNAKHEVSQRLARWLLLCADRIGSTDMHLSHDFLADMLGVTRSSVAVAAQQLREQGLIEYRRAHISIPDVKKLEQRACECYRVVRDHLDSYTEFDTGVGA
ncbi:MAG: Crp/Fnr family transcriptional regulator [Janthinobacterium lividum]